MIYGLDMILETLLSVMPRKSTAQQSAALTIIIVLNLHLSIRNEYRVYFLWRAAKLSSCDKLWKMSFSLCV